jgi:AraC-like DNA-binding protein
LPQEPRQGQATCHGGLEIKLYGLSPAFRPVRASLMLVLVSEGSGSLIHRSGRIPLAPGDMLICKSGSTPSIEAPERMIAHIVFADEPNEFAELPPLTQVSGISPKTAGFFALCAACAGVRMGAGAGNRALPEEVIRECVDLARKALPPVILPQHISEMLRILGGRYSEMLSLDSLAKELHMNKFKLVKDFKQYMGITPIEYLLEKRLDASACRLCSTSDSISEIAEFAGFNSTSYFVRRFKAHFSLTPLAYRNQSSQPPKLAKR